MRFFLVLFLSLFPISATSATIVEGVDYMDASPAVLGPFDVGTHTISGTLTGDCLGTVPFSCLFGTDPQDILQVSFASGSELRGLTFELANTLPSAAEFRMEFAYSSAVESALFSGLLAGEYVPVVMPVRDPVTLVFSGDTALQNVASYTADWSVTLDVAAVPLPGALGLLAASFLGLATLKRRRSS
ncbi:MAG: hypothetical protein AAGF53_11825 [Pseudomonadota bacterium]